MTTKDALRNVRIGSLQQNEQIRSQLAQQLSVLEKYRADPIFLDTVIQSAQAQITHLTEVSEMIQKRILEDEDEKEIKKG